MCRSSFPPSSQYSGVYSKMASVSQSEPATTNSESAAAPPQCERDEDVGVQGSAGRMDRRPKFTPADDLVIIREVAAAKAHVAPNGQTKERFHVAAHKANCSKKISCAVTWKSIQDRYKRLQSRFDASERVESAMSGVGGEVGEMEELLSMMRDARRDVADERSAARQKSKEQEAEKERLGAAVRQLATSRSSTSKESKDESPLPNRRAGAKRLHKEAFPLSFADDIKLFSDAIKEGDKARHELEKQRLELDRIRFDQECAEREKEREERRAERAEASRIDMEKFKLSLDALRSTAESLRKA
eukprot:IDg1767t1